MKKLLVVILVTLLLAGCANTESTSENNEEDGKITELQTTLSEIMKENKVLKDQIKQLEENIDNIKSDYNESEIGDILYFIHKLKDEDYISTYGDEETPKTWYIAAEELSFIGKPAIPYLIKNLETQNAYEKGVTLYALLLTSQHSNVKELTNGEYIHANLEFNPEDQEKYVEIAKEWWEKHKRHWEK